MSMRPLDPRMVSHSQALIKAGLHGGEREAAGMSVVTPEQLILLNLLQHVMGQSASQPEMRHPVWLYLGAEVWAPVWCRGRAAAGGGRGGGGEPGAAAL